MSLSELFEREFREKGEGFHTSFLRNWVRDTFLEGDERRSPQLLQKIEDLAKTLEYDSETGHWIQIGDIGPPREALEAAKATYKTAQAAVKRHDDAEKTRISDLAKLKKLYEKERAAAYPKLVRESSHYLRFAGRRQVDLNNRPEAQSCENTKTLSPEVTTFLKWCIDTLQHEDETAFALLEKAATIPEIELREILRSAARIEEAIRNSEASLRIDRLLRRAKALENNWRDLLQAQSSVVVEKAILAETVSDFPERTKAPKKKVEDTEAKVTETKTAEKSQLAEKYSTWAPFDVLEEIQHLDQLISFFAFEDDPEAFERTTGLNFNQNIRFLKYVRKEAALVYSKFVEKAKAEGPDPEAEFPSRPFVQLYANTSSAPFASLCARFIFDPFFQVEEPAEDLLSVPTVDNPTAMAEDPTTVDLHQDLFQTMQQTARRGEGGEFYRRRNTWTIEERIVIAALMLFESHFSGSPPIGPRSMKKSTEMIQDSLNRSLTKPEVRETFAKNVDIWMRLQKTFEAALPTLSRRSLREAYAETVGANVDIPESSTLIAENHATLTMDLTLLNTLLIIARNMLALKEVAQDICATVQFDKQVLKLIVLCVGVTSKGYDGENVGADMREKLNDVTELYKKLLVTCLQFTHNLTMGNDRQKTAFWIDMLFDNDFHNDTIHELPRDELRVDVVFTEAQNWLRRNPMKSPLAASILAKYAADVPLGATAGPLPKDDFSETNMSLANLAIGDSQAQANSESPQTVVWSENAQTKEEQDRMYARVSHEIDVWWKLARDKNYDGWNTEMETVENAMARAQACKDNAMSRYVPRTEQEAEHEYEAEGYEGENIDDSARREHDESFQGEDRDSRGDEVEEEEDEEDDDSYVEGPLRGLLTEVPNILDTKQIEALHMTVKACIVDSMGSGLTPAGENLQKTRCKMFLALDCGKNLLREMLVFIAVWEQNEDQFIFQISAQIIESFHHNALIPYAWKSLRILKDIVSPAQTVLLRLINYMFRARKDTTIYQDQKDFLRDAKLIFYLFEYFRTRVVPDCIGLIYAQAQIRNNHADPEQFPVDLWDMERAKDGLMQYLDFLAVIAEIPQMRPLLIEWEAVYELIALLNILEAGVERKGLVDGIDPANIRTNRTTPNVNPHVERPYDPNPQEQVPSTSTLPLLHDTPHKFPWSGIKVQILVVLTTLVAPMDGRRTPGNPDVQKQILKYDGIMPLLNCCNYDGHNEYLKERTTLALKWVMEGCAEAQQYLRGLQPLKDQSGAAETNGGVANVAARQAANIRREQEDEPVPGHVVESVD